MFFFVFLFFFVLLFFLLYFYKFLSQDKVDFSCNYWEELNDKLDEYLSNGDNKKYYKKVETSLKCKLYNETQDINTEINTE